MAQYLRLGDWRLGQVKAPEASYVLAIVRGFDGQSARGVEVDAYETTTGTYLNTTKTGDDGFAWIPVGAPGISITIVPKVPFFAGQAAPSERVRVSVPVNKDLKEGPAVFVLGERGLTSKLMIVSAVGVAAFLVYAFYRKNFMKPPAPAAPEAGA